MKRFKIILLCFIGASLTLYVYHRSKDKASLSEHYTDRVARLTSIQKEAMLSLVRDTGYNKKTIMIEGVEYTYEDIINDFINVSISKYLWLDDADDYTKNEVNEHHKNRLNGPIPWMKGHGIELYKEYLLREQGVPKEHVIHKWENEITVGFDWPRVKYLSVENGLKHIPIEDVLKYDPSENDLDYRPPRKLVRTGNFFRSEIVEKVVEKQKLSLEQLTNLPVKILFNDVLGEATKPMDSQIRVISNRPMLPSNRNFYDNRIPKPHKGKNNTVETFFLSGVPFTPFDTYQLGGYILPKADNTIGLSVCHIPVYEKESLERAYTAECLIRSLGFLGITKRASNKSALSKWNSTAGYSYDKEFDKYVEYRKFEKEMEDQVGWDMVRAYRKKHGHPIPVYPYDLVKTNGLENGLSQYDHFMIALLYCKDIKSGMSITDVLNVFRQGDQCIQKAYEKLSA